MKPLKDCEHTAFISYAHADDEAWFSWVTHFRNELERGLNATLRGVKLTPLHLSADGGPVAGLLGEQLEARIAASFAMIAVVHDNYVQSSWCLKELEAFVRLFGLDGVRERFYIVAMSERAVQTVTTSPAWQRLLPAGQTLWLPFFDERLRDEPIGIYIDKEVINPAFQAPFLRLRADLAAKLRRSSQEREAPRPSEPMPLDVTLPAEPAPTGPSGLPAPAFSRRDTLIGLVPPGSIDAAQAALGLLQQHAIGVQMLSPNAVLDDFAAFDGAKHLVLVFDDAPLLMPALAPGGHLQVQRDAWVRRGKPASAVHWLDLRAGAEGAAAAAPRAGAAAWVASQGVDMLDARALAARLAPPVAPPAAPVPGGAVRLYIESNRNERTLWEPLGEQIRRRWDELARSQEPGRVPPLALRPRALPVDQLDAHPPLDDADGIVLLWGRKTADALIAQINKVEDKTTPGRDAAPGIVAYLMPPQQAAEPVPAWGWQVLRFDAHDAESIDVVDTERDDLADFLRRVLRRRRRREGAAP